MKNAAPSFAEFDELISVLNLKQDAADRFVGASMQLGWARLYGGQVVAQSVVAAHRSVADDRRIHSMHCYFLRPGLPDVPLIFEVERMLDGGAFSNRRVLVKQNDKVIFTLSASFKVQEAGLEHQFEMPEAPDPESLPDIPALLDGPMAHFPEQFKSYWRKRRPMELRPIELDHYLSQQSLPPYQKLWIRAVMQVGDKRVAGNSIYQAAIVAYLSDMTLLDTSLFIHGRSMFNPDLAIASVDHSMWFHHLEGMDDWLFYQQESPATANATGLARGQLFSKSGKLLVSVAQEGLIRVRK